MSDNKGELKNTTPFPSEKLWNSNYLKVMTANFLLFFAFMLLTPLLPLYLADTYQAGKDLIGFVLSGYVVAALLIRPFSGFMVDSFPRRVVLLVTYSLMCAFFCGYLVASSLTVFAIFRTLHGAPFGAATVSLSTVAIDVLPSSRRAEGIGYYGLSNNIATAIAPGVAIYIYHITQSYELLFALSLVISLIGLAVSASVKMRGRELLQSKRKFSLDRFFLLKGWTQAVSMLCFSFSYGVMSTYVAIYGRETLGIVQGTGLFFMLLSVGLIVSRLTGNRPLRQGKVTRNASMGMLISIIGYVVFAAVRNPVGYYAAPLIIGLGNGHMYPAFQTMFINLAEHNQRGTANSSILTSWDAGLGLGVLVGGVVAELISYSAAFWVAALINASGIVFYFAYGRNYFLRNKLR